MSFSRTALFSFLLSGALFSLAACTHGAATDPRTGPLLVGVATAHKAPRAERDFSGVVSARVQSDLGFRVRGKLIERFVDAGQVVKRGQPLMRIDRTDYALAIASQAALVDAARAHAVQTSADEARYRDLVAAGAVSALVYDLSKAAADAARAQFEAAKAQAGVTRNEAGYSVLLADADGTVSETLAEPGQVVAAGQIVVRLAHAGPREATISLPETLRPAIGSTARATLFNSTASGNARLRQLSDAADPQSRTFDARYVLEGAAATAPLGSTVTIHVPADESPSVLRVPLAALFDNGEGPGVWIVSEKDSRVRWRRVQLAGLDEETAAIIDGLRPGEQFVALGAHLLYPGARVRVAPDQVARR